MEAEPNRTPWFPARKSPVREGWYEVVSMADGRMMADWRCLGGEYAFWIYADFGPIPMRRKIRDVRKWRGLIAPPGRE
jgi:hypothetical protein